MFGSLLSDFFSKYKDSSGEPFPQIHKIPQKSTRFHSKIVLGSQFKNIYVHGVEFIPAHILHELVRFQLATYLLNLIDHHPKVLPDNVITRAGKYVRDNVQREKWPTKILCTRFIRSLLLKSAAAVTVVSSTMRTLTMPSHRGGGASCIWEGGANCIWKGCVQTVYGRGVHKLHSPI